MEQLLLVGAAFLYLAATLAAWTGIAVRVDAPPRLVSRFVWIGAGAHLVSIVLRSAVLGDIAVATFADALSFLAFLLVAVFLVVERRRSLAALGAVVSPLALGLTVAAILRYAREAVRPLPPVLDSAWFPVHVTLAFLGDAIFALAFSASLLYLFQERRLKARRRAGLLLHLPSLETLDRLNHACVVWGLVLLTLGIATGIVWAHEAWGRAYWASDPKLVFSLITWAIYVVLLQGRMVAGWRGRRAATLTIAGFAVILVSLVGVNVLAIGLHGKAF
ncbi:MAG TPA: cytochrome c biogenesis protein CcsA [Candidatus Binatia bacterium]|nr:cytochrome c biogenesis protein CcsA [Candidatus Binatia bacterium]